MALELSTPCKRPRPPSKTWAISKSRTPSGKISFSLVSDALFASAILPGMGPKLTTTTDVQNHIVFLGIKPLDNFRGQLGDEGGGGLICLCIPWLVSRPFTPKQIQ